MAIAIIGYRSSILGVIQHRQFEKIVRLRFYLWLLEIS